MEFLPPVYFRCNATTWDISATNRLHPVPGQKHLYTLAYDVKEEWMVNAYDDCTLTATPAKDAWGDHQVYFGIKNGLLEVPNGSVSLSFDTQVDVFFKVKYPAVGRYQAYLYLGAPQPFLGIVPVTGSRL